jgi:hypothetical protein
MEDNTVSFTVADIPPSANEPPISGDLVCEVCGTPLLYSGRGRKPKFCDAHRKTTSATPRSTSRRNNHDVDAAMAALSGGHTVVQFALSLASLEAGHVFEMSRSGLDERNRAILESDPALAKRIASMASKGGAGALVVSHLIAVGPAAAIAYRQIRAAAQSRHIPDESLPFED